VQWWWARNPTTAAPTYLTNGEAVASAGLERRNALAQQQGFRNYYEKRVALRDAAASNLFERWADGFEGSRTARNREYVRAVQTYWQAFKLEPDNYRRNGAKARWFVEYEEIMDYAEWEERYPLGTRTGR
jgi:hypothetical protein